MYNFPMYAKTATDVDVQHIRHKAFSNVDLCIFHRDLPPFVQLLVLSFSLPPIHGSRVTQNEMLLLLLLPVPDPRVRID